VSNGNWEVTVDLGFPYDVEIGGLSVDDPEGKIVIPFDTRQSAERCVRDIKVTMRGTPMVLQGEVIADAGDQQ
jgi:hypothetical protein